MAPASRTSRQLMIMAALCRIHVSRASFDIAWGLSHAGCGQYANRDFPLQEWRVAMIG